MTSRPHHRPLAPGDAFFDVIASGADPAQIRDATERAAILLVRGARAADESQVRERLIHLAETEGLDALAELWADAPPESVAGCLWRLYLLRTWVYADPVGAARQFDAGRSAEVAVVVAGVADPPGPDELRVMADQVLGGIATTDFADVLLRGAAFARVVAAGRHASGAADAGKMTRLADQLERAGYAELHADEH